jgi:menaquinone-dependent protoporphyrinogen oxidase
MISEENTSKDRTVLKSASHRQFLKTGCIGAAAIGLAACGVCALALDPTSDDPSSFTFGGKNMSNRALLAYASAMGSSMEVATTIGETLGARRFSVDVRPIKEQPHVDGYQAALLGSAVQYGSWLPEAVEFVKTNQRALNQLPVALLCVHIQNLGDDETSLKNRLAYLDAVRPLLQPATEGFFTGRFDRRGAALMLPGWLARFVPPLDFRNWVKIRAWAENIL